MIRSPFTPPLTWRNILALGLGSRVLMLLVGMMISTHHCLQWNEWDQVVRDQESPFAIRNQVVERQLLTSLRRPLLPWYRFDANWYAQIAREGYDFFPDRESSVAFLPLLPILMAGGSAIGLDQFWVGWIIPNLAFAVGLVAFGRIAARLSGNDATAWRACLLLIAFPASFFFSAPYEESLGFALSTWGIWAWMSHRSLTAAGLLSLSTAARLSSVATSVAIGAEWLVALIRRRQPRIWALPVAIANCLGLGVYLGYLHARFGDPFVLFKSQAFWRGTVGSGGLPRFALQFVEVCQTQWLFDVALVGIVLFLTQPWSTAPFQRIKPAIGRRVAVVAGLALMAGVWASIDWHGAVPVRKQLFSLYWQVFNQQDNLAFALFLGLGLRIWLRHGFFWGCLVLVPIGMGAITGSPMSMKRIVLMAFPGFIEAAELARGRWLVSAILIVSAFFQFALFYYFSGMIFMG